MLRSFKSSPRGSRKDEQMGSVGNCLQSPLGCKWYYKDITALVALCMAGCWWSWAWSGSSVHDWQHWVVLQGHTSHCIKYGVVSVIQVGDKPPWIPQGQHASLAVGLGTYVGNLASANITPQCIGLPTMKQETDLEASSPMKPALSASAAVSASMANGDRWGPSSGGSERSLCLPGRHGH